MKKYFKYFIYVSIIFLVIALYKANYLKTPEITSLTFVILSVVFLASGFIFDAISWKKTLDVMQFKTPIKYAIISIGLSIFGKYIPGKIWLIAGRSSYIASKLKYSEKDLLSVSVITQIISLWIGLLFGMFGLILLKDIMLYGTIAFIFWIFLTLILFTKYPHEIFIKILNTIFKKKKINIPFIKFIQIIRVLPWYFIRWSLVSIAFYFLVSGLTIDVQPIYIAFAYALAGTLGLAVIFVPGGVGVREGILTAFFKLANFPIEIATSISITSRLWFLIGELFIFLLALILNIFEKNEKKQT